MFSSFFLRHWYKPKKTYLAYLLMPLAGLYALISYIRYLVYTNWRKPYPNRIPVIVIGNITLGGVGKTPLVVALYQYLLKKGYKPAIISRGYGRQTKNNLIVREGASSQQVGDEPLMLYQMLHAPIVIANKRIEAMDLVYKAFPSVDIVLSDDGLQHYQLQRDIEIAVIDAKRQLGNGLVIPAGPLRERPKRLERVDFIIYNGNDSKKERLSNHVPIFEMTLKPTELINLLTDEKQQVSDLIAKKVYAVAGIGNPERFFATLKRLGYEIIEKTFPDHHQYQKKDLSFDLPLPIIMTEKDAVKCRNIVDEKSWYLKVETDIDGQFFEALTAKLKAQL